MNFTLQGFRSILLTALWILSMTFAVCATSESLQLHKTNTPSLYSLTDSFSYNSTQNNPTQKEKDVRHQVTFSKFTPQQSEKGSQEPYYFVVTSLALYDACSLPSHLVYTETTTSRL